MIDGDGECNSSRSVMMCNISCKAIENTVTTLNELFAIVGDSYTEYIAEARCIYVRSMYLVASLFLYCIIYILAILNCVTL